MRPVNIFRNLQKKLSRPIKFCLRKNRRIGSVYTKRKVISLSATLIVTQSEYHRSLIATDGGNHDGSSLLRKAFRKVERSREGPSRLPPSVAVSSVFFCRILNPG